MNAEIAGLSILESGIGINREIVEAFLHASAEGNPVDLSRVDERNVRRALSAIRRAEFPRAGNLRDPVTRNEFLAACFDLTVDERIEHLLVGYGYRYRSTTVIGRIDHVRGQRQSVAIPPEIDTEIRSHHKRQADGEVIVLHNHPRTGAEPEWFHLAKLFVAGVPVPSAADRELLQRYAYSALGILRHLSRQGRVLFYLAESDRVREIKLPNLGPLLRQFAGILDSRR